MASSSVRAYQAAIAAARAYQLLLGILTEASAAA